MWEDWVFYVHPLAKLLQLHGMSLHHPPLAERLIGEHIAEAVAAWCVRHGLGQKLLLVADDTTLEAFGNNVVAQLPAPYSVEVYSLGKDVKAEKSHVEAVAAHAKEATGLLAVGAGTVNDITKYAAYTLNKPYIAIATAASMNGYSSATASLAANGIKTSYAAVPPRAVLVDLDVIKTAPKRLTRAGLGDTVVRTTVEADCLLSHYFFGTHYPKEGFDVLRAKEPILLHESLRLVQGDKEFLRCLIEALLDAGDWMCKTGSSAIASQGEHMIAHTAEMLYAPELRYVLHGELVAVAAVALSHLQQKCLLGAATLRSLSGDEEKFNRIFGKHRGAALAAVYRKKVLSAEQVAQLNSRLEREWPEIKAHIRKVVKSPLTLERALLQAHIPVVPRDIKLDHHHFATAMSYAHFSRDRFGFLDIAAMMGKRV